MSIRAKSEPTFRRRRRSLRGHGYFKRLGPGIVTGAADDDPSGIATYSQVGAAQGLSLLWMAPFLLPLAVGVQESTARLGLVTAKASAREAPDILGGHLRCLVELGAVPRKGVYDNEPALASRHGGRAKPTESFDESPWESWRRFRRVAYVRRTR